jgi:RNA polymerase sigma factor (sigma-70 family)
MTVSSATVATVAHADQDEFGPVDEILGETARDLSDNPCLGRFSILVTCPLDIDGVSECCTADLLFGAQLEPEGEGERQLVGDLQASMQLSRSLSGVAGVTADGNEAWREFHTRYNPWIRRAVRAYRVRPSDRNDCAQEVWIAILCKLESFDTQRLPCRFGRWMATLIQNQIRVFLRRRVVAPDESLGHLESYPDRADRSPAAVYRQRTTQWAVREVLEELRGRLPAASFSVIELRWLRDASVPDTAAALGITCEQVHYRQYRAMKKLGQLLRVRGLDELGAI